MGNLTEARRWGENLLLRDGAEADSYYLVATIQMEENEPALAESTLKRALYLDPHHLLSHFLIGSIMNRHGKKRTAVKHFQNAKELLEKYQENEVVPGSDGLTAGRIREIVETLAYQNNPGQ
jgi:chemotaxis protein methyltransferase CheR